MKFAYHYEYLKHIYTKIEIFVIILYLLMMSNDILTLETSITITLLKCYVISLYMLDLYFKKESFLIQTLNGSQTICDYF